MRKSTDATKDDKEAFEKKKKCFAEDVDGFATPIGPI